MDNPGGCGNPLQGVCRLPFRYPASMDQPPHRPLTVGRCLECASHAVTQWTGGSVAFALATGLVLVWAACGPIFHYSEEWQMVINTGTTIITFLMVFLIQRAQNKDSKAIHLKLNEIVSAMEGASNRLIDVEDLSEQEIATLRRYYAEISKLAKRDRDLTKSHSIEEAAADHEYKERAGSRPT